MSKSDATKCWKKCFFRYWVTLNLIKLCTLIDSVATFTVINIFFKMPVYNIGKLLHKRILKQQCASLGANTYLNESHMVPKMMTEDN